MVGCEGPPGSLRECTMGRCKKIAAIGLLAFASLALAPAAAADPIDDALQMWRECRDGQRTPLVVGTDRIAVCATP